MLKCRDVFNLAHGNIQTKKKKAKILCCFLYIWENKVKLIDTMEQNHLSVHILYAKFVKKRLAGTFAAPVEKDPPSPESPWAWMGGAAAWAWWCLHHEPRSWGFLLSPAVAACWDSQEWREARLKHSVSNCFRMWFQNYTFLSFKAFTWFFSLTVALAVVPL